MPYHRSARSFLVPPSLYGWAVATAIIFIVLILAGVVPRIL